jgi:hypothetical protein
MDFKACSEYSDDGIYVLSEDELDSQTVLDLQLELSIIKKRLRSTELAYRALVRVGFAHVGARHTHKADVITTGG